MLVQRRIPIRMVLTTGVVVLTYQGVWSAAIFSLYAFAELEFLRIPFLPVATVGTAVAFYVGFKNNAAYERFWEARKIWGGIVNSSRSWTNAVLCYVHPGSDSSEATEVRRELVYRQLAWVNSLRVQLRATSRLHDKPARATRKRLEEDAAHMRNDWHTEVSPFLSRDDMLAVEERINPATHLLAQQGTQLAALHADEHLDLFKQLELMKTIDQLYALQGKCERIKNTPFPRQYAEFSRWFTRAFIFLLPFGLLDVFADRTQTHSIAATITTVGPMLLCAGAIAWVFVLMESIGDASEDPFERSMNDVPMNALSRTIERDLRQMLGETEVPPPEPATGLLIY